VVGVDVAEAMIHLARRLQPQLDFRQADAHELPFEDDSFDAVVAISSSCTSDAPSRQWQGSCASSARAAWSR
jgi:hypothetical protein